jgi:hypothetical protein
MKRATRGSATAPKENVARQLKNMPAASSHLNVSKKKKKSASVASSSSSSSSSRPSTKGSTKSKTNEEDFNDLIDLALSPNDGARPNGTGYNKDHISQITGEKFSCSLWDDQCMYNGYFQLGNALNICRSNSLKVSHATFKSI